MAAIEPCLPCCSSTPQVTNVPGSAGSSAITTTSSSTVLPAIGSTVTLNVGDTSWLQVGKNVFVSDAARQANFIVTAIGGPTSFTGRFLGLPGDSGSGTISSGALVMAGLGDQTVAWDLDALSQFTDNSGGTKSDTIASTIAKSTMIMPLSLAGITGNGLQLAMVIPFAFVLTSILFRVTKIATTGGKLATLTAQVNGSSVTGGVVNLTTANCGTYGASVAGSAISNNAANTGTAGQTIGFITSLVTAFSEGDGFLEFGVTNTDLGATVAAVAFKMNQLRTALRHQ